MKRKTQSARETQIFAKEVAENLIKKRRTKNAVVIGLIGDLGAGKTTFVKSFTRSLGVKRRITSPTFLILRRFGVKRGIYRNVFHIDAYRVGGKERLPDINFAEIIKNKSNIVLVEWADRVKRVLPKDTIWVQFKYGKERNEREIIID